MVSLALPFSTGALQSALRRFLSEPHAEVGEVVPRRLGGGFSGSPVYRLKVSYSGHGAGDSVVNLVYKEGAPWAGSLADGSASREISFYRTFAPQLPIKTPRVLMNGHDAYLHETDGEVAALRGFSGPDWVLLEALPTESVWPQARWTEQHYRGAILALAELHARWWGNAPDRRAHDWVWTPTGNDATRLASDAHNALLEIEGSAWAGEFFAADELRAWLDLTADPSALLDILNAMPHTLIHGDYWPGNIGVHPGSEPPYAAFEPAVFDWQFAGVGPSSYDLACLHATSRWWFGTLPMSLVEMRNLYLDRLNRLIDERVDRALFDLSLDAARAWRFATFWPHVVLQYRAHMLARKKHLQATMLAPALASLRRCLG